MGKEMNLLIFIFVLNISIVKSDSEYFRRQIARFEMEREESCPYSKIDFDFDEEEIVVEKYLHSIETGKYFEKINKVLASL